MADVLGTELSEEKESETELRKRQRRPWDFNRSGKKGVTPELPETLGFFDISAAKREQQESSAGKSEVFEAATGTVKQIQPFLRVFRGDCTITAICFYFVFYSGGYSEIN